MARNYIQTIAVAAALLGAASVAAQDNRGTKRESERGNSGVPNQARAGTPDTRVGMMDRRFMVASGLGDMMEIDLSRMAIQRASNERIRNFARRLEQDHQNSSRQLTALARDKGVMTVVTLAQMDPARMGMGTIIIRGNMDPMRIPREDAAVAGRREELSGATTAELDRLGLQHMMAQHQEVRGLLGGLSGAQFDQAWIGEQVKHHARAVADFEFHARHSMDPEVRAFANQMLPTLRQHYRTARDLANVRR